MSTPRIVVQPDDELLTLEEARLQCHVQAYDSDGHPDDPLILALITAARENSEKWLGLSLVEKTYEIVLDAFPSDYIDLQMSPVWSLESFTYYTGESEDPEVDSESYVLDNAAQTARLRLIPASSWPTPVAMPNGIKIRFVAGYNEQEPCPQSIKAAVLLLVAHLYKYREEGSPITVNSIPFGIRTLLRPYRVNLGLR